jgi:hypothetical protein
MVFIRRNVPPSSPEVSEKVSFCADAVTVSGLEAGCGRRTMPFSILVESRTSLPMLVVICRSVSLV